TVGGGNENVILSPDCVISGGAESRIGTSANGATIGGGTDHLIDPGSVGALISGGVGNHIGENAIFSMIGGGESNQLGAEFGVIGGGAFNLIFDGDHVTIG